VTLRSEKWLEKGYAGENRVMIMMMIDDDYYNRVKR
jgi:hypothetical protein